MCLACSVAESAYSKQEKQVDYTINQEYNNQSYQRLKMDEYFRVHEGKRSNLEAPLEAFRVEYKDRYTEDRLAEQEFFIRGYFGMPLDIAGIRPNRPSRLSVENFENVLSAVKIAHQKGREAAIKNDELKLESRLN